VNSGLNHTMIGLDGPWRVWLAADGDEETDEGVLAGAEGHNQLPKLILGVRFADGLEVTAKLDRRQATTTAA
jgi:hypothetical protein